MDPTLEALFQRVVEDWEDDERHGKFVGYAQQNALLGEAARLYRHAAMEDGSPYRLSGAHVADAKKRLGGIAALAVMDLDAQKQPEPSLRGMRIIRIAAVVVFVTFFGLFAWALTRR